MNLGEYSIERKALEIRRVAVQTMVDAEFVARHLEIETLTDQATRNLILRLRSSVLADRLDPITRTFTVEVPATWWDHFKTEQVEATSPLWRWVARRWPPRTVLRTDTLTVDRAALYPNAHIALPERDFGRPVFWATVVGQ